MVNPTQSVTSQASNPEERDDVSDCSSEPSSPRAATPCSSPRGVVVTQETGQTSLPKSQGGSINDTLTGAAGVLGEELAIKAQGSIGSPQQPIKLPAKQSAKLPTKQPPQLPPRHTAVTALAAATTAATTAGESKTSEHKPTKIKTGAELKVSEAERTFAKNFPKAPSSFAVPHTSPAVTTLATTRPTSVANWKDLLDFTAGLKQTQQTVSTTELKSNLAGVAAPKHTIVSVLKAQGPSQVTGQNTEPSEIKLHMNTVRYSNQANKGHTVDNRIGQTAGAAHSIQNALLAALNQEGGNHSIYSFHNPLRDFPSRGDFAQVLELLKANGGQEGNKVSRPKLSIGGFELALHTDIPTDSQSARSIKLWFKVPGSDTEMKSIVLTEFTKPASFTQALSKDELKNYRSTLQSMGNRNNLTFVSKAGIGRSAALSVYNQLANLIDSRDIKTNAQLEHAFYEHIAQGRSDRGVRFLDVAAQRESIMAALQEMLKSAPNAEQNLKPNQD